MIGLFTLAAFVSTGGSSPLAVDEPVARFVVVVANNHNLDEGGADLRFADDDGALFLLQLTPYARRAELLTTFDDDSQRRFPALVKKALPPTRGQLLESLRRVFREIEVAAATARTELLFVFVGHGGLDERGQGFLHLQGSAFKRADLFAELIGASPAHLTHIVIDACQAYSLVAGRGSESQGPATRQEDLRAFLAGHDLDDYPAVGVLVAQSRERETHEWSAWQAGVFSHQVRSALMGGADVNADGLIDYSEVAAFVAAANHGLEAYDRVIETFAWPPQRDRRATFLDLRAGHGTRFLVIGEAISGHLYLESARGVRWADLHKSSGVRLLLAIPAERGFFLRDGLHEREIGAGQTTFWISEPLAVPYRLASRGAVDRAFELGLYATPFGSAFYRGYLSGHPQLLAVSEVESPFVVGQVPAATGFGIEAAAGYQLGTFAIRGDRLEHGFFAHAGITPVTWLAITLGVEMGFTNLAGTNLNNAIRFSVLAGTQLRYLLVERLNLHVGLELGYGYLALEGIAGSSDPTVGVGRVRAGIGFNLWRALWFNLDGGASAFLFSKDNGEAVSGRGEILVGVGVRY